MLKFNLNFTTTTEVVKRNAFPDSFLLLISFTLSLSGCGKLATDLSKALESQGTSSKLKVYSASSIAANSCAPVMLLSTDDTGNVANQATSLQVTLAISGDGTTYSDAACTTTTSTATINQGSSSATFYVKSANPGSMILNALASGYAPTVQPISVAAATGTTSGASKIQIAGSSAIYSASCVAYLVSIVDAGGLSTNVTSTLSLTTTGLGSGAFYSDAACATALPSVQILSGTADRALYYKNPSNETNVFSIKATGYQSATMTVTSSAPAVTTPTVPAKIQISGSSTIYSNSCTNFLVSVLDSSGLSTALTSSLAITTNGLGSGSFYTDSSCSTTLSSLSILSGTSYRSVYYKTPSNETNVLFLQATGYQSASLTVTSNTPSVSVPQKLLITGSGSSTVNLCAGPYTVKVLDQNLIQVNVGSNVTVNMSSASGNLNFFSNNTCTTALPASALTVTSGTSQTNFYIKTTVAGDQRIQAEDPSFSLSATQLDMVMKAGAADHLELSSVNNILVDSCQSTFLFLKDAQNNILTNSAPVNITLSDSGSGAFYTDASCTQQTLSLLLPTGPAQLQFYFKNSVPETTTATASKVGLTSGTQSFTASQSPSQLPTKLLLTGNNTVTAGNCSSAYTISVKDVNNTARSFSTSPTTVTLLPASTFYSDSGCTSAISSVNFTSGQSSKSVFIKRTASVNLTLTAQTAGLTDGTVAVQVLGGAAHHVAVTGSTNISVGQCAVYDVAVQDILNNLTAATGSLSISLSSSNTGTFYTASDCSTGATTSMTINVGGLNQAIYYKAATTGTHTLTASPTMGLANGTLAVNSSSNPVTKLTVTSVSSGTADQCQLATVTSRDAGNFVTNVGGAVVVGLTSTGSATMYSNATCTTPAPTVTIGLGTSSQTFYYKNTAAESVTITAASSGLTSATFNYATSSAAPSKIRALGSTPINVGACSAITVDVLDANNNSSAVSSGTVINVTGLSSTAKIYSDSGCVTQISSLTMLNGESTKFVYYKNTGAEALSLNFDDPGSLTASTFNVTTQATAATQLSIVAAGTTTYGVCLPMTVSTRDQFGNLNFVGSSTVVTLGGAGTGAFYTSSGCSTTLTSVTFTTVLSQASVYFKTPDVGSYTVTATGGTLTDAGKSISVQAGPATQIRILGSAAISTDTCTVYTAQVRDAGNITASVASNTVVNLSATGSGAFYSDANCAASTTGVTITTGNSQTNFYYKNSTAQTASLTADDTGSLTAGTLSVALTSAGGGGGGGAPAPYVAVKLAISGPSQALSGACAGEFTLYSADSNGSVSPVTSAASVSLSDGPGSGTFYSDATCSTTITSISFAIGESTKPFYYKDNQAESIGLSATTTSLTSGSFPLTVGQSAQLAISREVNSELWSNFFYKTFGTVSDYKLYATNSGQTEARTLSLTESLAAPFSFKGGSFPGQGGTCQANQTLLPGEQCSMVVRFQPTAGSLFPESFTLSYSNGASTLTADHPLSGEGSDLLAPKSIAAGYNHTCVRYSDMSVKCWGRNNSGQLGVGDTTNYGTSSEDIERLAWTRLAQQSVSVSAGEFHSCAVDQNGKVVCWGDNSSGQLGIGAATANIGTTLASLTPSYVSLGTGRTAISVSAGSNFTCSILDNGQVKCWGNNDYGQLGLGDKTVRGLTGGSMGDSLPYVDLGTGRTAVSLTTGGFHACAILDTNSVKCWGRNFYGQLGLGDTNNRGDNGSEMGNVLPTVNIGSGTIRQVVAGHEHTCAIWVPNGSADAQVNCWGRNDVGQLGIADNFARGTSPSHMGANLKKADLGLAGNPAKIALGGTHTCVLLQNGSVKCWGGNSKGQLGIGNVNNIGDGINEMGNALPALSMGGSFLAQDISAGYEHTCILLDNREMRCFGRGDYGQLGHLQVQNVDARGQSASSLTGLPAAHVNNYSYAESIGVGNQFSCAIFGKNSVTCWGTTSVIGLMPKFPSYNGTWTIANASKVVVGSEHACVLTTDNKLYCWGKNDYGQVGNNSNYAPVESPVLVQSDALDVATDAQTTCYAQTVAAGGAVKCVGRGDYNQTGTGTTRTFSWQTIAGWTPATSPATKVGVGQFHACALLGGASAGQIYCWGYGLQGQLGRSDNGVSTYTTAAQVNLNSRTASDLSLGDNHSCAILSGANAGKVICWGRGTEGQLGNGQSVNIGDGAGEMAAVAAIDLPSASLTAKAISAFGNSTCVITSDDRMKCWGQATNGELGNNGNTNLGTSGAQMGSSLPYVAVGTTYRTMAIAQGSGNSMCGVFYDVNKPLPTQTFCWGLNTNGQLGDGGTTSRGSTASSMSNLPLILNPKVGVGSASTILADYQSGSGTFTVPDGVTAIEVQVWGAGGSSGYDSGGCWGQSLAAGGGGGYTKKIISSLTSGKQFSFSVGAGALTNTSSSCGNGTAGGTSWFDSSTSLYATGGNGGSAYHTGGSGGAGSGGDVNISGTTGGTYGGGGGGAPLGGIGGLGVVNGAPNGASMRGGFPGGGGGGGGYYNPGGNGGSGRILVKNASTNSGGASSASSSYTSPGVYIYTVPSGVYSLRVQMWGGGGGGAGSSYAGGCGGGSGGYIDHVMQVSPGNSYLVSVGAGGTGGVVNGQGINGGDTKFGYDTQIITAGGGYGGNTNATGCNNSTFGYGGVATNGVVSTPGNRGATSPNATQTTSGGSAPNGGAGGAGFTSCTSTVGNAGQAPGGGGGGASDNSGSWCSLSYSGGAGAVGRVVVTPFFQ